MDTKLQSTLGATSLVAATITTGLLAGVYYAYATSVMPALGSFDDKTFVEVMNKISVVIVNPWFMLSFLGSIAFAIAAGAFHLRAELRPVLIWIAVGLVLNLISFFITSGVNVPLNNQLATANGAHGPVDYAALRQQFEGSWVHWNVVRGLFNTAAIGTFAWALVLHGRLSR